MTETEEKDEFKSEYMGELWTGFKAIKDSIQINSSLRTSARIDDYMELSGLHINQVATNIWGFPFIPYPEPKPTYQGYRMAPKNVTTSFLGHPIYWIKPELTMPRENETAQEWNIRMFFLIDAMGLWDEVCDFIDFLKFHDFSYDQSQIKVYHSIADQVCESDEFDLLDETDLYVPMEEVEKKYIEARKMCSRILDKLTIKVPEREKFQEAFAERILGEDVRKMSSMYNNRGGMWDRYFVPKLEEIAHEYNNRAESGSQVVSDLLSKTRIVFDNLEDSIIRINHATSILSLPVLREIKDMPGGAARLSILAKHMAIANSKDNLRKRVLVEIDNEIEDVFVSGNRGVGGFDEIIEKMKNAYAVSWNRLRLAFINYQNLQTGDRIYANLTEMQAGIEGDNIARGSKISRLEDVLGEDMR